MTEEKIIELRGNHLIPLYSKYQSFLDKKNGRGISLEASLYLDEISINKYGSDFTMSSNNLYYHLFHHPEQKVKIINGDDILCSRCFLKGNSCQNNPNYDRKIAEGFGLEINRDYTMKEITEKLENEGREFYERNSSFFALNAFLSLSAKKSDN